MLEYVRAAGLDGVCRAQIKTLDAACSAYEPLSMKLNWDMLETRAEGEINDLLCYEDGAPAGYLGLYQMGLDSPDIEMTGMVRPDCRRRGIFTALFGDAVTLCRARGAKRILLIAERRSRSGIGFAENAGLSYSFSEYRMRCHTYQPLNAVPEGFALRPAASSDTRFLKDLDTVCFGSGFADDYEKELGRLFVAVAGSADIGKIGLIDDGGLGYVFGVAILPEYQRRGYGRAMLDAVLKRHFDRSPTGVILEVATKNDTALSLYRAVGFETVTIYDYYEKAL